MSALLLMLMPVAAGAGLGFVAAFALHAVNLSPVEHLSAFLGIPKPLGLLGVAGAAMLASNIYSRRAFDPRNRDPGDAQGLGNVMRGIFAIAAPVGWLAGAVVGDIVKMLLWGLLSALF
jgi:hypothetical protein